MSRPDRSDRPEQALGEGAGADRGAGALVQALDRWRRAVGPGHEAVREPAPPPGSPGLTELARRLDDTGCGYGRVSAARLEHLTRAYERLELKLNAVLMAVTGTFLSTLAGLLLYYVRGGSQ